MTSFIQPKGSTTITGSTEVLSQILNISNDAICPLEPGTDLTNFQFGLDPKTKQLFNISGVTGLFNSVSVNGTVGSISTNAGSFQLPSIPSALTTIRISTVADLRKFIPWFENQMVYVERYNSTANVGGGFFIGHYGSAADNGGTRIASGNFYWDRNKELGEINITDFGADPTGTINIDKALIMRSILKNQIRIQLSRRAI